MNHSDVALNSRPTTRAISCTLGAFAELSGALLQAGAGLRFVAHGASMAPLIRDGDTLTVRPVAPGALRLGDVVLCALSPERVVAHRVVGRSRGPAGLCVTIQGDQVDCPDGVVAAAQLLGRVVAVERQGVSHALASPQLRLLGWFAALRSRWGIGRGAVGQRLVQLLKRLPFAARHLV